MTSTYQRVTAPLLAGESLGNDDATDLMKAMMGGHLEPVQVAAILTALRIKGVTATELAAFARTMRAHAVALPDATDSIDTCGTGGSGLSTANTSTMVAFVLAAAGLRVTKHGNRSSSGKCGSADVLEALGVQISATPELAARVLAAANVCFLFAPAFHPAMRHVGAVRRTLGFRTVFNFLGPLCNPARPDFQVLGVSDERMAGLMAAALAKLGVRRALVVHGRDGLDELSPCAPTLAWRLEGGAVEQNELKPEALGVKLLAPEAIRGGDVAVNTAIFEAVLGGEPGPHAEHVALNAGAGLYATGRTASIREGVRVARKILGSGDAMTAFERFRDATVEAARAA